MGHLGFLKQQYQDLVARLDAGPVGLPEPTDEGARAAWQEILEILYTPEDAELASRLPVRPSTLEVIAKRVGIAEAALAARLDLMADKGLVMDLVHPRTGVTRYMLSPPVVGFFEYSLMRVKDSVPKKRMAEALEAYTRGDDAFAREVFGTETVIGRALVHETALGGDQLPTVLDWERATALIEDAKRLSVSLCYCRHKAEHLGKACGAPVDNCLTLNGGADYIIRRKFGREVQRAEALEVLAAARDAGLVQIADNVQQRPLFVCNCCGCCCGQLTAINDFDLPAVNPSGYRATPKLEACKGCSRCARACPIGAIEMVPKRVPGTKNNTLTPRINVERCIGCGVCVGACRQRAMGMEARPHRSYVPRNPVEKSVRMALERGRLPHLLVDGGAGRGSRFFNQVLQGICSLPVADRALASEQVRSRFIAYMLGSGHKTKSVAPRGRR